MQHDITTGSSGSDTVYGGTSPMSEERQFTDYMSDIGDTVYSGAGRVTGFFADRPLLAGSVIFGGIGAFIGSRIASMVAMQRRQTTYDRAMDALGLFIATLGTRFSERNRERASKRLSASGRDLLDATQDWTQAIADRVPVDRIRMERIPRVDKMRLEKGPSAIKRIGYGLSLIPVTMALIRNPLIRDIGFRFMARRIRPSRRRWL